MVHIEKLPNGLTLIVEELPHFQSVSYDLHIPGGLIVDPEPVSGISGLLTELTERGAGSYDSRQLSDAYDALGARHSCSSGIDRYVYRGTVLSDTLPKALQLMSMQVQSPTLPEAEIPSIQELLLMDTKSLGDAPARLTSVELTKRFLPSPFNRSNYASEDAIGRMNRTEVQKLWDSWFKPSRAILSVAGNCSAKAVVQLANKSFGSWGGSAPELPAFSTLPPRCTHHIQQDSAQTQICLAYPSCKFGEPLYYAAKVANEILSGGMFGRLFIEVREKRGLCYSVNSRHSSGKHTGSVFAYAGTTPERASETLEVMLTVLKDIRGTITADELGRAKANLKATLIISEESPGSRSSSNAGDYWLIKRVRTLEEVSKGIDAVTTRDIDDYIEQYPPGNFSLVTLGSKEIKAL